MKSMRRISFILICISFCLCAATLGAAGPEKREKSSAGIVNDALRKEFPAASAWDIGGQFRLP
jgi:hypothetical protein